jgi:hypothetical protein
MRGRYRQCDRGIAASEGRGGDFRLLVGLLKTNLSPQ